MDQQKIKRINELYKKSKAEGLTDAERKEQKIRVRNTWNLSAEICVDN